MSKVRTSNCCCVTFREYNIKLLRWRNILPHEDKSVIRLREIYVSNITILLSSHNKRTIKILRSHCRNKKKHLSISILLLSCYYKRSLFTNCFLFFVFLNYFFICKHALECVARSYNAIYIQCSLPEDQLQINCVEIIKYPLFFSSTLS